MKIYWSINSIPEARELDFVTLKNITWRCWFRAFRKWQVWIGAILLFSIQIFFWKVGKNLFGSSKPALDMLWQIGNMTLYILAFRVAVFNYSVPCIREEIKFKTKS